MTERPILFSGPMVRRLLDGSKKQTRRSLKPKDAAWVEKMLPNFLAGKWDERPMPYGKPGDTLWVRETWNIFAISNDHDTSWPLQEIPKVDPRFDEDARRNYAVDYPVASLPGTDGGKGPWRPAIHMPRWASRISLLITDVKVERLQDISEGDAKAEGVRLMRDGSGCFVGREGPENMVTPWMTAKEAFADLWENINGPGSWAENPWVVAVTFERINEKREAA